MGRSGKARRLVLRGLAPFFPPFVPLPGAACSQTTKATCLAASGGTEVTADSGTLGDGGTLHEWESTERPGSRKDWKCWAIPCGFSGSLLRVWELGAKMGGHLG